MPAATELIRLDARLPAHLEINALIRRVAAEGGFGSVLQKGEPDAGTILLVLTERGGNARIYERMPGLDGLALADHIRERHVEVTLVMMSAFGTVELALEAMRRGAYDYISKPFKHDEVVLTLRKAEERLRLRRENTALRERLAALGKRPLAPALLSRARAGYGGGDFCRGRGGHGVERAQVERAGAGDEVLVGGGAAALDHGRAPLGIRWVRLRRRSMISWRGRSCPSSETKQRASQS